MDYTTREALLPRFFYINIKYGGFFADFCRKRPAFPASGKFWGNFFPRWAGKIPRLSLCSAGGWGSRTPCRKIIRLRRPGIHMGMFSPTGLARPLGFFRNSPNRPRLCRVKTACDSHGTAPKDHPFPAAGDSLMRSPPHGTRLRPLHFFWKCFGPAASFFHGNACGSRGLREKSSVSAVRERYAGPGMGMQIFY